jgi:hypothetical protein
MSTWGLLGIVILALVIDVDGSINMFKLMIIIKLNLVHVSHISICLDILIAKINSWITAASPAHWDAHLHVGFGDDEVL